MGKKFCPNCEQVVVTKAFADYSQVEYRDIMVKRRKIVHLEEDGGCSHIWYTVEMPEDILDE